MELTDMVVAQAGDTLAKAFIDAKVFMTRAETLRCFAQGGVSMMGVRLEAGHILTEGVFTLKVGVRRWVELKVKRRVTDNAYTYRNLPADCVPAEDLWCVSGSDTDVGGGGVLEWCVSEVDARDRLEQMQNHRQFKNLKAEKYAVGLEKQ